MSSKLEQLANWLKQQKNIDIIIHKDPDGDTIGSSLAFRQALQAIDIEAEIYCTTNIPDNYAFLPDYDLIKSQQIPPGLSSHSAGEKAAAIVALDCATVGQIADDLPSDINIAVNIDHHIGNTRYSKINLVYPLAAATGEIILLISKYLGVKITPDMAQCLYVSLSTDTGHFMYGNTTKDTLFIASELITAGVDPADIAHKIYEQQPLDALKAIGEGLMQVKTELDGRLLWSYSEDGRDTGPRTLIDIMREVDTCEIVVVFKHKEKQKTKVSFRSKTDYDVRRFAEKFGGGGHPKAAGLTMALSTTDAARKIIPALIEDMSKHYIRISKC
jgi:phosphoesterase RecJ-like protein